MRSQAILFRTTTQLGFPVQVFDQLRFTPRCNQFAFVSEWRKEFEFHALRLKGRVDKYGPTLKIVVMGKRGLI